eukprot:scaffold98583_cov51-Prasinocladus_malaysianus.AAC.2
MREPSPPTMRCCRPSGLEYTTGALLGGKQKHLTRLSKRIRANRCGSKPKCIMIYVDEAGGLYSCQCIETTPLQGLKEWISHSVMRLTPLSRRPLQTVTP